MFLILNNGVLSIRSYRLSHLTACTLGQLTTAYIDQCDDCLCTSLSNDEHEYNNQLDVILALQSN
jgi:hypothetical protein